TLDLVVDHFFFDMRRHPWAVRSILERYRREFSYSDRWGLTFQHDMGVANTFATSGHSAYELPKRQGCFSFMCQEELVNWILAAVLYTKLSNDIDWLHDQRKTMDQCMASLIARDNTDKRHSIGLMQHDSDRCEGGWEITTYDSMDFCLGRACGNLYLGVKTWAAWLALEWHYELWEQPEAAQKVRSYAQRAHDTLCASFNSQTGIFPAQLDGACGGAVLPAVEGLIFPWYLAGKRMLADDYPYAKLIQLLRQHAQTVLQSRCRFKDGGWKLSESAENSWLSKIYLSQAIISGILGYSDPQEKQADLAHQSWLLDEENSVFAWSDQMRAGKVCGSRNYPRGVTATLWLELE
ncbi:MAG TPA: glycoside hydrolase family 52 protein, partial [Fibrobacteraceae bacterium]|nr:glycoside hydrolase family 52 protein [Fibrobacteraceae bacterium]